MNKELFSYLSKYIKISNELADIIDKSSLVKKFNKGTTILNEGDKYQGSYFVLKGCLRSYKLKDADDITIDFYLDEQPIIPTGDDNLSNFSLECLEDSLILINNEREEEILFNRYPELKTLCLELSEILSKKIQNDYMKFKTSTPEERYLDLIEKKPELVQRVPQYQIASFLGIKPESLSRIKKRLLTPQK